MNQSTVDEQSPGRPYPGWDWAVLLLILLLGAGLRLAYLAEIAPHPTFTAPMQDPLYNDYWARALVTGDWTVPPGVNNPEILITPFGRPPGYPYFLAGVYKIFGLNYFAPRLVQMALGLLNVLLAFFLARAIFGRIAGLAAAAFMATYWSFIYFEGLLTYPAVVTFLLLSLMLLLRAWRAWPGFLLALACGAVLGLFGLFRPNGLLFAPFLLAWMCWLARSAPRWRLIRSVLGVCLGVLLMVTPALVRNYRVGGEFIFISSYGGLNFYVGNHAGATCVEPKIPELKELAGIDNWTCFDYPAIVHGLGYKQGNPKLSFGQANHYFYGKAFDFIREHPRAFLMKTIKKALLFWGPKEVTNDTVMEYDKRFSALLHWMPGFPFAVAFFALGLLAWWRSRNTVDSGLAAALLLFVAAYFLSVIPFFIAGRYRMPITPFLLIFGGYGIVWLLQGLLRGPRGAALAALAAFLALFAAANCNITGYQASEGTWHFHQAVAYAALGNNGAALREYQAMEASGGDPVVVSANAGRLLSKEGRSEEAIAAFRRGLEHAPKHGMLHNNLGWELARLGRTDEAVAEYEAALAANPKLAIAEINWGHALSASGKFQDALGHYKNALTMAPGDPYAAYNAGRMLLELGEMDQAIPYYRQAIQFLPRFPEAYNGLGYALAAQSHWDDAIAAYSEALTQEPQYVLARVNLARTLEQAGKAAEAVEACRQVLNRDPNNQTAQEMLRRLEK